MSTLVTLLSQPTGQSEPHTAVHVPLDVGSVECCVRRQVHWEVTKRIIDKICQDIRFARRTVGILLTAVGQGHHIREVHDAPRYKRPLPSPLPPYRRMGWDNMSWPTPSPYLSTRSWPHGARQDTNSRMSQSTQLPTHLPPCGHTPYDVGYSMIPTKMARASRSTALFGTARPNWAIGPPKPEARLTFQAWHVDIQEQQRGLQSSSPP